MPQSAVAINRMVLDAKLAEGDKRWFSFNNSFENCTVDTLDLAHQICQGHAYTSWHEPALRCQENWKQSQFIAVDMDTEDERSTLKYLDNHDLVINFGSIIHTTPSHTDERPRARVVFLLDRPIIHPLAYGNACRFVTTLMGGDTVATDPSRFFYGNCNARVMTYNGVLSVDYLWTLYQRHRNRTNALVEPPTHDRGVYKNNRALQAHGSTGEDKMQVIAEALPKIDPWGLPYLEWVGVIGAIKRECGEAGLDLAVSWANGKPGEVERMWKSLRRESGKVTTIASIVHYAKGLR